jgi:hypothetical protein
MSGNQEKMKERQRLAKERRRQRAAEAKADRSLTTNPTINETTLEQSVIISEEGQGINSRSKSDQGLARGELEQINESKNLAEQLAEEAEQAEMAEDQARKVAEEQRRRKEMKQAQMRQAEERARMEVEAAAAAKRKAEQDKAWKEAEAQRRQKEAAEHAKREAEAAVAAKRKAKQDKAREEAEEQRRRKEAKERAKREAAALVKKQAEDQARKEASTPIPLTFGGYFKGRPSKRFILVTVLEARMAIDDASGMSTNNENMRRQLRIKVANKSKYSSVDAPLLCDDGRHINWPWVTRSFRLSVPQNVSYARFELMGPSTSTPLCCKMPLSTLVPGVEIEQWFDMQTKRTRRGSKANISVEGAQDGAMQLHLKLQLVKERQIRVVGGGGSGRSSGGGRRGSFMIARGDHAGKSTSTLDEETKRNIESFSPGRVYHKSVQLQNEELGQVLVAPRTNSQGVPLHLRHMPHAHLESFIMHQFTADLISHRQSSALIDELSGTVAQTLQPLSQRTDEDIDVELGMLLLAGDGRLRRSPEMSNLHSELLSFMDLEELDEDSKFLSESAAEGVDASMYRADGWDQAAEQEGQAGRRASEAQAADIQAGEENQGPAPQPPAAKRLHFQPHISQLLNEWFVRGVAGACVASADKGRGIVVVDAAYETELVSRLSHHLAMWRLPTMRVVGVALNGEKNDTMLSDYRVSKLDVNHSHFILCARPENLRNMATDMSMCRSSPAVDAAEVISESFKSTKAALLQVRGAVRARLNHKQHEKHEQIRKQQQLGADKAGGDGTPLDFLFGKGKPKIKPVFAAGGAVPGGHQLYDAPASPAPRQVSRLCTK